MVETLSSQSSRKIFHNSIHVRPVVVQEACYPRVGRLTPRRGAAKYAVEFERAKSDLARLWASEDLPTSSSDGEVSQPQDDFGG